MKKLKLSILLIAILLQILVPSNTAHAQADSADFEINTDFNILYTPGDNYVSIEETLTIKVLNSQYRFPGGSKTRFTLPDYTSNTAEEREYKLGTLSILNDGSFDREHNSEETEGAVVLLVEQHRDIRYDNPYTIKVSYNTHDLVNINGNITNLFIPGLKSDSKFTETGVNDTITKYNYKSRLVLPLDAPEVSYMQPPTINIERNSSNIVYSMENEDLLGTTGWIQIGKEQYAKFKLTQKTPKTDNVVPEGFNSISNLLSTNIYKVALPRNYSETSQTAYYTNISPKPTKIEIDSEGNTIGTFEVPANTDSEIVIEGYIALKRPAYGTTPNMPDITLTDYLNEVNANSNLQKYTKSDIYWNTSDPDIVAIANELKDKNTKFQDLILADYNYVVDTLEYDDQKLYGENTRIGASEAIKIKTGVCMEYADLLIAILRTQGIPSRAAFGYGNDPILTTKDTENQISHQWVQIWTGEYGWITADPTWGETERKFIGGDMDHFLWYVLADFQNPVYDTILFSANIQDNQELPKMQVELETIPVQDFPSSVTANTLDTFITPVSTNENEEQTPHTIDFLIKTTMLGKVIIITTPVCLTLIFLIAFFVLFTKVFKKIFRPKNTSDSANNLQVTTSKDEVSPN